MNLNQVVICGRLGKVPEMRYTSNGNAVANFSLAISSWVKKKEGEGEGFNEQVVWIDVTAWGKNAERTAAQATVGTEVLIVGRLDTRSWEDKNDPTKKHYRTFVTALNIQFGHGRVAADAQAEGGQEAPAAPAGTTAATPPPAPPTQEEEDDLPF
jgi:single-strand DNA-binding protein